MDWLEGSIMRQNKLHSFQARDRERNGRFGEAGELYTISP